ncbi:periplasmic binding protein-like I [Blastocladiella britannica]|nr:periplasmic binding protein-like I [Blastocladiella britannica]
MCGSRIHIWTTLWVIQLLFGSCPVTTAYQNFTIGLVMPTYQSLLIASPDYVSLIEDTNTITGFVANDWNERYAHPAGYHFNLEQFDSLYTRLGSVAAALAAANAGAVALIGEWSSINTIPLALTSQYLNLPVCSGSSTSDDLSSKTDFPLFFRTIPPDSGQGKFLAHMCRYWSWESVNLIHTNEAYGESLAGTFRDEARKLGVAIVTTYIIDTVWSNSEYLALAEQLKASTSRINMVLCDSDWFYMLYNASQRVNFGREWTWMGPDSLSSLPSLIANYGLNASEIAKYQGIFYIWPAEAAPGYPRYDQAAARWSTAMVNDKFSTVPYSLFAGACFEALGQALIRLVNQYGAAAVLSRSTPAVLGDYLADVETVTGPASFDANGNRIGIFEVKNVIGSDSQAIFRSNAQGTLDPLAAPIFPDGTSNVPSWAPQYESLSAPRSHPAVVAATVLASLVILATIAVAALFAYKRRTECVKHLGGPFIIALCYGMVLALSSIFAMAGEPTRTSCAMQVWASGLGFSVIFSGLGVRSFRIFQFFDNRILAATEATRDRPVILRMLILPSVVFAILVVLQLTAPLYPSFYLSAGAKQLSCATSSLGLGLLYMIFGVQAIALTLLAVTSFATRHVRTPFKDSLNISYAAYHLVLATCITSPIALLFGNQGSLPTFYIKSVAVLYASLSVFASILARHAYCVSAPAQQQQRSSGQVGNDQDERDAFDSSGASSLSTNAHGKLASTLSGVFPIRIGKGVFDRWINTSVVLHGGEATIILFDPSTNTPGTAFYTKVCTVDPAPAGFDSCVGVASAGMKSIMIQFSTPVEQGRWVTAMALAGSVISGQTGSVLGKVVKRARAVSVTMSGRGLPSKKSLQSISGRASLTVPPR